MNDPITMLQAMFDCGHNALIVRRRGRIAWEILLENRDDCGGMAETVEEAIEALAAAACQDDQNSNFARFHRGEINYFRCVNCHKPFFDEEAVEYPDLGEVCLDCDHALPSAILADNLGAEITRTKELLSKAEQALASGNFDAMNVAHNELTRAGV